MAASLACIDKFRFMFQVIQDLRIEVEIIDDHIGILEAPEPLDGQEPDITGTRTDEEYFSFSLAHQIRPAG
jgi:hypothetical protein